MAYVDGFLIPIPKKNVAAYKRMATMGARLWLHHGALGYCEASGDDLQSKFGVSYRKLLKLKPTETAVFAWIVFKSKAHRNKVNAAVMKDPRMKKMCPDPKKMPFDCKRMSYGGFKTIVLK